MKFEKEIKQVSKVEVDIYMCRLQGAIWEDDQERINKILKEIRERVKEVEG